MDLVYTPLSFLKRVLVGEANEWNVDQTIAALRKNSAYLQNTYQLSAEEFLEMILADEKSPLIKTDGDKLIWPEPTRPQLYDLAYAYIIHSDKPQSLERIFEHVQQKAKLPANIIENELILESDRRLVQLTNFERWFLVDWEICNDQLYELLLEEELLETTLNDLHALVNSRLQPVNQAKQIFIADIDPRFQVRKKGKVTIQSQVAENSNEHNQLFTNSVTKEEILMSTNQKVFDVVCEQIKAGIESLRVRDEQMAEEVVQFFKEQNLAAIEDLLEEKKAVLALKEDLVHILEKRGK